VLALFVKGSRPKALKIDGFDYPTRLTPRLQRTPANIRINLILPETAVIALHLCCWKYGSVVI